MGLFATLASSAGQASAEAGGGSSAAADKPSSSSGPSDLPTAVQLYTSRCVDFLSGTIDGRGGGGSGGGGSGGGSSSARRKFEVLTYQAVEVLDPSSTSPGDAGGEQEQLVRLPGMAQRTRQARKHTRPNLGVWDCRLPEQGKAGTKDTDAGVLTDRLLAGVVPAHDDASPAPATASSSGSSGGGGPTVLFAVDLSDAAGVYPAVDAMRTALLRRYENAAPTKGATTTKTVTSAGGGATTRLSKLRAARFGAAPQSKDGDGSNDGSGNSAAAAGPDGKIALVVCCAVPSPSAKGTPAAAAAQTSFQTKQAQNLVLYHLHKFASDVDCTLAFVRGDGEESSADVAAEGDAAANAEGGGGSGSAVPSVTVSELATVVRRVAAGLSPVEENGDGEGGESGAAASGSEEARKKEDQELDDPASAAAAATGTVAPAAQPPIYPPGAHDDDLIGSVLLRNASCPGVWDAATDDLWKALPPNKADEKGMEETKSKSSKGTSTPASGDEAWLSKLAESVASLGGGAAAAASDDAAASVKSGKGKDAPRSAKKKKAPPAAAKGDDPTSFFENLLKK